MKEKNKDKINSNQIKLNQTKSNQIKPNQIKLNQLKSKIVQSLCCSPDGPVRAHPKFNLKACDAARSNLRILHDDDSPI